MTEKRKNRTGRIPKNDPAVFRYTVRFNEEEHNRFLSMFERSGVSARSVFIKAHFFGLPFRVLTEDKNLVVLYTAFLFSRAIPCRREQLQPSSERTEEPFFREKGNGIAV